MADDEQPRCTARAKSTGQQCRNPPIRGGTVCRMHGGAAPQVRRSATLRLDRLVAPAVTQLARILVDDDTSDAVRLRAIEAVLNRTGHPARTEIDLQQARESLAARLDELASQ